MQEKQPFFFDFYRIDPENECVWRGKRAIRLTTKVFSVLYYLVEHAGRLVTKEELFQAVWPGTVVSDAALTICVGELRRALRDEARTPRFIETVHRRGYRFIAPVATAQPVQSPRSKVESQKSESRKPKSPESVIRILPAPSVGGRSAIVGREAELGQLQAWLKKALAGQRHMVFVTGEPGIGKTTVVDAFLAQVESPKSESPRSRSSIFDSQSFILLDWTWAVHRTPWRRRSLPACTGGTGATLSGTRG